METQGIINLGAYSYPNAKEITNIFSFGNYCLTIVYDSQGKVINTNVQEVF
jgi:hypothetical protein